MKVIIKMEEEIKEVNKCKSCGKMLRKENCYNLCSGCQNDLIEKKKKCENCGSRFVYVRLKEKSVVCRSCGHIQKIEEDVGGN